jgi:peptidoglycan biosynthesis protein MviN/MurJ (putative lipid II flippase)
VGISISQAIYSRMSQSAGTGKLDLFRRYYWLGMAFCIALTIPGAIFLVAVSPAIVWWFKSLQGYEHVFMVCLALYAISIPFESLTHVQYRAFYSFKQTLVPAVMGVVGGLAAIATAYVLLPQYGLYALAAGYTVGEIVQAGGLAATLPLLLRRVNRIRQLSSTQP